MNNRLILLLTFTWVLVSANGQDSLSVDWHRNISSNNFIDQIFDIESDSDGNIYSLGAFPVSANCLGQPLDNSTGSYLLTKLDSLGNLLYAVNLGNQDYLTFGELELTNSNELIIGVNFRGNFYYGGNILTSNSNYSSLLLKLDSNLNLLWFEKIPCIKQNILQTYINGLTLDDNQNIYTSIQFIDSIELNGNVYTSEGIGYSFLISKFDFNGDYVWSRQYDRAGNYSLSNRALKHYRKGDHIGVLLITGAYAGDTLFIDGAAQISNEENGTYVSKLDINGNILESELYTNVNYIVDFEFLNDRIFCTGVYSDSVFWPGNNSSPTGSKSAFICELSQVSTIIDFHDLTSTESLYLTDFDISDIYGFIISGSFYGSMSIQTSSISLANQFYKGAVIASFDQNFMLSDSKYITGGSYNLRKIDTHNQILYGAGIYKNNCSFENTGIYANNDDISIFRSSDFNSLPNFNNQSSLNEINTNLCDILIYPNPSGNIFNIRTQTFTIINLTTIDGRIIQDIRKEKSTFGEFIDLSNLKSGTYFLNLVDCVGKSRTIKLDKTD